MTRVLSYSVLLAGAFVLAGCGGDNSSKPAGTNAASSGSSVATAPVDYLSGLAKGKQNAVKTVDTASLEKAVELFGADKGRNPRDLDELVKEKYIPKVPEAPYGMKLQYDATAGKVKVVKQ